jgi:hypothetical protein
MFGIKDGDLEWYMIGALVGIYTISMLTKRQGGYGATVEGPWRLVDPEACSRAAASCQSDSPQWDPLVCSQVGTACRVVKV